MAATLKVDTLQNASSATANITLDTAGNATVGNTLAMGSSFLRNRIINGGMDVAQRGTSFSSPAALAYTLDRWAVSWAGAAPATVAQVAGPAKFRNAIQITGAASNTVTYLIQRIEALNCSDLSGSTVTLQANVAVSSSQTVAWYLYYANASDNFGATTYITGGTWSATSTATTFSAVAASLPAGATNGLQLIIAPNNGGAFTSGTITITGVQLEVGSVATPFERRQYGTELMLCQRYLPAFSGNGVGSSYPAIGLAGTSTIAYELFTFPVTARKPPSGVTTSGSFSLTDGVNVTAVTSLALNTSNTSSGLVNFNVASGLTQFRPYFAQFPSNGLIYFTGCEL